MATEPVNPLPAGKSSLMQPDAHGGWRFTEAFLSEGPARRRRDDGAQKRTRTSTPLLALVPETSASTNSAIWASGLAGSRVSPSATPRSCQLREPDLRGRTAMSCSVGEQRRRRGSKNVRSGKRQGSRHRVRRWRVRWPSRRQGAGPGRMAHPLGQPSAGSGGPPAAHGRRWSGSRRPGQHPRRGLGPPRCRARGCRRQSGLRAGRHPAGRRIRPCTAKARPGSPEPPAMRVRAPWCMSRRSAPIRARPRSTPAPRPRPSRPFWRPFPRQSSSGRRSSSAPRINSSIASPGWRSSRRCCP